MYMGIVVIECRCCCSFLCCVVEVVLVGVGVFVVVDIIGEGFYC